jgi:hypothetical protein
MTGGGGRNALVALVEALRRSFPTTMSLHDLALETRSGTKATLGRLAVLIDGGFVQRVGREFKASPPPAGMSRSEWVRARAEVHDFHRTRQGTA